MQCPRCQTELETINYEGVEIETCPDCEGEWLDQGELATIVKKQEASFPEEMVESMDRLTKETFTIDESSANQMKCPKCPDSELNRFIYAATSGIALDKCPTCGGVWLDKNELEMVQVLVEEWMGKVQRDKERFSPFLDKVEADRKRGVSSAKSFASAGAIGAILRRFV